MRTVPVTNATEQRLLRSVLDRLEDGNISGAQHLLRERLNALAQLAQQESTRKEVDLRRARAARIVSLDRPMLLAVVEVTAEVFAVVFDAHILALLRRTCHAARSGGVFNTHHTTRNNTHILRGLKSEASISIRKPVHEFSLVRVVERPWATRRRLPTPEARHRR